jgi:hypothetical protein
VRASAPLLALVLRQHCSVQLSSVARSVADHIASLLSRAVSAGTVLTGAALTAEKTSAYPSTAPDLHHCGRFLIAQRKRGGFGGDVSIWSFADLPVSAQSGVTITTAPIRLCAFGDCLLLVDPAIDRAIERGRCMFPVFWIDLRTVH